MSVYTELLRIGMADPEARLIADVAHEGTLTKAHFDTKLAELETRIIRTVMVTMIAMTGIFATFVGAVAWVLK